MNIDRRKKITATIAITSTLVLGAGMYVWADSTSYTAPPTIPSVTVESTGHLVVPNPDGEDISINSNDLRKLADELDKANGRVYNVYDHFARYPHYHMEIKDNNDGTNSMYIEFTEQPLTMPTYSSTP